MKIPNLSRARPRDSKPDFARPGSALVLVTIALLILAVLGVGVLTAAYGTRLAAIQAKTEAVAMLAAEAGYEKAIFWMSQQEDMFSALQQGADGLAETIEFPTGYCDYDIRLYSFVGSRPVYKIVSSGHSGRFSRTVDVFVMQAVSGWDMGMCRVPLGPTTTSPVYFADGEIIDVPLHINKLDDNPDQRDIYTMDDPLFLQNVAIGESRYTDRDYDKYRNAMGLFEAGICFDQPDSRILDEDSVQSKITRFKTSTKSEFTFKPVASAPIPASYRQPTVQLEFFVENDVGKVRITNNCTVYGYKRSGANNTLDYKIQPGHDGQKYETYYIYSYHFMPKNAEQQGYRFTKRIDETYVSQSFGGVKSEPGGQIFVDGNVVIGGDRFDYNGDQVVKGKITVTATGNIWIADSIMVDGSHDAAGKPTMDNTNVLGLIAQGVIKVVDPGMSGYGDDDKNNYPDQAGDLTDFEYVPVGRQDTGGQWVGQGKKKVWQPAQDYDRHLPDPMIVEAAITVGGGGWGAENVECNGYGNRKELDGNPDRLIVRGSITEAVRGVVGLIDKDGFIKQYYLDARLLEGILPGDVWLRGKFIPAPAGWHDYRTAN